MISLDTAFQSGTLTQAPLPRNEVIAIGIAVLALVAYEETWQVLAHFQVLAHEGTHAIVRSVTGGTVTGITVDANSKGETKFKGGSSLISGVAGYLGPSAFGLGAAKLIAGGHILSVLYVTLVFLGLILLTLNPSFAVITVPLFGVAVFFLLRDASLTVKLVGSYAIAWLLLLSGPRRVIQRGSGAGDAKNLDDLTTIPGVVWALLWLGGTGWAAYVGARWLLVPG
jgi:Peptidase M50B-like